MDEREFQRLLQLFPVVRSRDCCQADAESSGQSTSQAESSEAKEWQDAWVEPDSKNEDVFWDKLRSAAEKKVGSAEAEVFCKASQQIYHKLVHEDLSQEVMENFLNSS